MYDENIPYGEKEEKIVAEFRRDSSRIGIPNVSMYDDGNHYFWDIKELRKKYLQYGSLQYITDVLVRGMFHEHHISKKSAFFDCFGDQIYYNLNNNLPAKTHACQRCGKRFVFTEPHQLYCDDCLPLERPREIHTAECVICGQKFKTRNSESGAICPACLMGQSVVQKTNKPKSKRRPPTYCVDCGAPLDAYTRGRPSNRCSSCQHLRNRSKVREWKINKKNMRD